jgi:hypothetical protein
MIKSFGRTAKLSRHRPSHGYAQKPLVELTKGYFTFHQSPAIESRERESNPTFLLHFTHPSSGLSGYF